jgi:hypothetical protein
MSGTFSLPPSSKVLLRSPQIATRAFGIQSSNSIMQSVPKIKFEFYVQFVLGAAAKAMLGGNPDLAQYSNSRGLSFKVKTVDKPKIQLQTEELNQYNKKVIVYKKVEYSEASIRLHDTVDNSVLATWVDYFTYYFADSRQKNGGSQQANISQDPEAPYEQSPYSATMDWDSGWGFQPLVNNDTHFFTGIIVYSLFANTYTAWEYVNPKITNIDWQSYDYSSSDLDELNIQVKYEAIRYLAFAQPISNQQSLAFMANFGFTQDDYINPPSSQSTPLPSSSPRIFTSAQAATPNTTQQAPVNTTNISNPSGNVPTQQQTNSTAQAAQNNQVGAAPGAVTPTPNSAQTNVGVNFGNTDSQKATLTTNTGETVSASSGPTQSASQSASYINNQFSL